MFFDYSLDLGGLVNFGRRIEEGTSGDMLEVSDPAAPIKYKQRKVSAIRQWPKGCGPLATVSNPKPITSSSGLDPSRVSDSNKRPRPDGAVKLLDLVDTAGSSMISKEKTAKLTSLAEILEPKDVNSSKCLEHLEAKTKHKEVGAVVFPEPVGSVESGTFPPKRRKISAVRDFPIGCGRYAPLFSKEGSVDIWDPHKDKSLDGNRECLVNQKPVTEDPAKVVSADEVVNNLVKRSDPKKIQVGDQEINGENQAVHAKGNILDGEKQAGASMLFDYSLDLGGFVNFRRRIEEGTGGDMLEVSDPTAAPIKYKQRKVSAIRQWPKGCSPLSTVSNPKPITSSAGLDPSRVSDSNKRPQPVGAVKLLAVGEEVATAKLTSLAEILKPKDVNSSKCLEHLEAKTKHKEVEAVVFPEPVGIVESGTFPPPKRRKISAVRDFPSGCGRYAPLFSKEGIWDPHKNKSLDGKRECLVNQKPVNEDPAKVVSDEVVNNLVKRSDTKKIQEGDQEINGENQAAHAKGNILDGEKQAAVKQPLAVKVSNKDAYTDEALDGMVKRNGANKIQQSNQEASFIYINRSHTFINIE